jgi:hypothetical protein
MSNPQIRRFLPNMDTARKLRIQFTKNLKKGYVQNAKLDPSVPSELLEHLQPTEQVIVEVTSRKGGRYFFTDRRVYSERDAVIKPLCCYNEVRQIHWMSNFSPYGMLTDAPNAKGMTATNFKSENYDRLVLETSAGDVVLDGLQQSYSPIFEFLRWNNR